MSRESATEFGKKREAQVQAEAARKARAEKLEKLTNLTDEQLAKLLSQVEGEAAAPQQEAAGQAE